MVNILYFLEPGGELGNPTHRLGTVRNHLRHEMRDLLKAAQRDDASSTVALLASSAVIAQCEHEKLLPEGVLTFSPDPVRVAELRPDALQSIAAEMAGAASPEAYLDALREAVGGFRPDVVLVYEGSAASARAAFPGAFVINEMLGLTSRDPLPESVFLDPFGLYGYSVLNSHAKEIRAAELDGVDLRKLANYKRWCRSLIEQTSPIPQSLFASDSRPKILLALQVGDHFSYQSAVASEPGLKSQLDLVRTVADTLSDRFQIIVSEHPADRVMDSAEARMLLLERPGVVRLSDAVASRWQSHYVMSQVDGVISVASSVGLQTSIWDKPLCAPGRSHLAPFAETGDLRRFADLIDDRRAGAPASDATDRALLWTLKHYSPTFETYFRRKPWLYDRIMAWKAQFDEGRLQPSLAAFEPITPDRWWLTNILASNRVDRTVTGSHALTQASSPSVEDFEHFFVEFDVVSFDVFDTLISRAVAEPRHVWDMMATRAERMIGKKKVMEHFNSFADLRRWSADRALSNARKNGDEEYTLIEVYLCMAEELGFTRSTASALAELEYEYERKVSVRHAPGHEVYSLARKLKKSIVYTSDSYLPENVVSDLLRRNGYSIEYPLFVSSAKRVTKKSARLFDVVRSAHKGKKICHVGDNIGSDIRSPRGRSIAPVFVQSALANYVNDPLIAAIGLKSRTRSSLTWSLYYGPIIAKYYQTKRAFPYTWLGGSLYRAGFEYCGPFMLGFSSWILSSAINRGVKTLYFMARDGYVPYQICLLLIEKFKLKIKVKYIRVSRRALSVPAIFDLSDAVRTTELASNNVTLAHYMQARFGLDIGGEDIVIRGELVSPETEIDGRKLADRHLLRDVMAKFEEKILATAAKERASITSYFRSHGLTRRTLASSAFVDLGHNGSLQYFLSKIFKRPAGCFYFATFTKLNDNVEWPSWAESYHMHAEDRDAFWSGYTYNLGMFELAFLEEERSLSHFESSFLTVTPRFVEGDESKRFEIIRPIHEGILGYASEVINLCDEFKDLTCPSSVVVAGFMEFLKAPTADDARLFKDVSFVDRYGGNAERRIVKLDPNDVNATVLRDSWWQAGMQALIDEARATSAAAPDADRPS